MSIEFTFALVGQRSSISGETIVSLCEIMKKQGFESDKKMCCVGFSGKYGIVEEAGGTDRFARAQW